jgi:hypothetical protein
MEISRKRLAPATRLVADELLTLLLFLLLPDASRSGFGFAHVCISSIVDGLGYCQGGFAAFFCRQQKFLSEGVLS